MKDFPLVLPEWTPPQEREVIDPDLGGAGSAGNRQELSAAQCLAYLNATTNISVLSAIITVPSGSEDAGDAYIVPHTGATGAFASKGDKLAVLSPDGVTWLFLNPVLGWIATAQDNPACALYFGPDNLWHAMAGTEQVSTATSGTVVLNVNANTLVLTDSSAISALTIDLSAAAKSGKDVVVVSVGGVTALTVAAPGATPALTALTANTPVTLRFSPALSTFLVI